MEPVKKNYRLKKVLEKSGILFILENQEGQLIESANKYLEAVVMNGSSWRTAATYGYDLVHFYRWMEQENLELKNITEKELSTYIKYQREQQASARTINHRLSIVEAFYKFCFCKSIPGATHVLKPQSFYRGQSNSYNMGLFSRKKVQKKLRVKVPKLTIKPLEVEEVKTFIGSIRKYRDLAITYFMLHCGLRSIEVINLKASNISHYTKEVVVRGKGDKERVVYLSGLLIQILDDYYRLEKPQETSPHLFVVLKGKNRGQPLTRWGLREIFRYKRIISGITHANPHRFRHTCGADWVRAGMSLRVIQRLLGHENISQTAHYTNVFQRDIKDEFYKAHERLQEHYNR